MIQVWSQGKWVLFSCRVITSNTRASKGIWGPGESWNGRWQADVLDWLSLSFQSSKLQGSWEKFIPDTFCFYTKVCVSACMCACLSVCLPLARILIYPSNNHLKSISLEIVILNQVPILLSGKPIEAMAVCSVGLGIETLHDTLVMVSFICQHAEVIVPNISLESSL